VSHGCHLVKNAGEPHSASTSAPTHATVPKLLIPLQSQRCLMVTNRTSNAKFSEQLLEGLDSRPAYALDSPRLKAAMR